MDKLWFVRTNDVAQLWAAQPTFLISQAVFLLSGVVTFIHALRKGGRWPWFWLATILHGIYTDNIWAILLPDMDNFWHSQAPVMFFGGRQPLHIFFVYPALIYQAAYAVSRLNLPLWSEPFAVGLVTVLIDIPYDIVAVKFVHWVWHDTDPNIFDRHYWVPWNSYFFHATFAASLYWFFHATRKWFAPKVEKWTAASFKLEIRSLLIAILFGMPGGVVIFAAIYHPLHDVYYMHSEVAFFLLFSIFSVLVFSGLMTQREKSKKLTAVDFLLLLTLFTHFIVYWAFVMWANPENEWSTGFHEPVGPCDQVSTLKSPLGMILYKRKFLCLEHYDEGYFDFHCVNNQWPAFGALWYTVCGTPFENRAEYITVISTILLVAFGIFYNLYFKVPVDEEKSKQKSKKIN